MALGTLTLTNGSHKVVEAAKALRYHQILHGEITDPTPDEQEKVMHITDVRLPKSYQPKGYKSAITSHMTKEPLKLDVRPVDDENSRRVEQVSLTHEDRFHPGIPQGKMASLPLGDQ